MIAHGADSGGDGSTGGLIVLGVLVVLAVVLWWMGRRR